MKAKIDIQTTAGKSLEGFPKEFADLDESTRASSYCYTFGYELEAHGKDFKLSPGDKIIIEVLP